MRREQGAGAQLFWTYRKAMVLGFCSCAMIARSGNPRLQCSLLRSRCRSLGRVAHCAQALLRRNSIDRVEEFLFLSFIFFCASGKGGRVGRGSLPAHQDLDISLRVRHVCTYVVTLGTLLIDVLEIRAQGTKPTGGSQSAIRNGQSWHMLVGGSSEIEVITPSQARNYWAQRSKLAGRLVHKLKTAKITVHSPAFEIQPSRLPHIMY